VPSVKVKSITFAAPPFRKLGNMSIEFSDRLTVIAGHNGIGKSTIMALVANCSGLTSSQDHRSLFGKTFQANLFDIVYLDYDAEYLVPRAAGLPLPEPQINYLVNGTEVVVKACSITGRSESEKARVVARSVPPQAFASTDGAIVFGPDAKVPLPTIYLGMIRMFPVGEANPNWVRPTIDSAINQAEKDFISRFINDVVVGSNTTAVDITSVGIKGTGKLAKHPTYGYDTRCVSLGQDSLGTIATALASFSQLKREWPEYPGGLLILDELDAGLHPHAQGKLIQALKRTANQLNLQIIATTHSTHVVEAVHPDGTGNAQAPDSIVYLIDTELPRLASDFSLRNILDDMSLKAPAPILKPPKKQLKVYFEDDEAAYVFGVLVTRPLKLRLSRTHGIQLSLMPLSMGCNNLAGLSRFDPYFKQVLIVLDADASIHAKVNRQNIIKLPGAKDAKGKGMSPEKTLYAHIVDLVENPASHPDTWAALHALRLSTNQLRANLLSGGETVANRESSKKWWRNHKEHIKNWGLFESWASENQSEIDAFLIDVERVAGVVAGKLQ
jgi:energy-coupling factor transporter ATP-binding protein EcfA2